MRADFRGKDIARAIFDIRDHSGLDFGREDRLEWILDNLRGPVFAYRIWRSAGQFARRIDSTERAPSPGKSARANRPVRLRFPQEGLGVLGLCLESLLLRLYRL